MLSGVLTEIYKDVRGSIEKKREKAEAEKAEIENASHQYEKNYRERHGQVKVFCVGMREPIPLDHVYVAVQFLDDHSRLSYRSPEEVEIAFRHRYRRGFISNADKRKDGTMVANEKQYLMLLGGPGVGKSTFLRKVGLEALKGENGNFEHACIPVFVELKRFTADQINIETLITEEFRTCGYPDPDRMTETALKLGKLLILFDGLDEVPAANVDNVVSKMGDFVDQYSQNRFIASCRIAAYKGGFTRFTEVEMADFDDDRIEAYIKNWFNSTSDQYRRQLDTEMGTAERCWDRLNETEHAATLELARNPLLLTLLCMVYDNSQNLPWNRADLYEKALNIFLEEWSAEKRLHQDAPIIQYLDIADEKRMLSEIAAKNFEENRLFFSKDELINQIQKFGDGNANTPPAFNASKILETILVDQGLFVERVRGSYSFSHLTFQEYLTANYIVGDTRSIQGLVGEHLHDQQWREIFLLIAGRMREADDLLIEMEVEAAKYINTDGLKALGQWIERITNTSNGQYDRITQRAFAIQEYFSLQLMNKVHKEIKDAVSGHPELEPDFSIDQVLHQGKAAYLNLVNSLYPFHKHFDPYMTNDPYFDLADCDLSFIAECYPDIYLYFQQNITPDVVFEHQQDPYQYTDISFYSVVSSELVNIFNEELKERIAFVRRVEEAKIFKRIDLQRMIRRFEAQREFIRVIREGKFVEPPRESIHNTWLSVLQITDNMFAISIEEMERYAQYVQAMELIFQCKKVAGRVSPKVWNGIENRFLTWEAVENET